MQRYGWLPLMLAFTTACGGGSSEGGGESTSAGVSSGGESEEVVPGSSTEGHQSAMELIGVHPPSQPWSEMSHDDRQMDMIGRFLPIFTEVFQEFDDTQYSNFGCETCHGADMRERNFAMPSAELPPVPPAGTDSYRLMATARPEVMRFMEETVMPDMQTMLGVGATFTCNGCHPTPEDHASAPATTQ